MDLMQLQPPMFSPDGPILPRLEDYAILAAANFIGDCTYFVEWLVDGTFRHDGTLKEELDQVSVGLTVDMLRNATRSVVNWSNWTDGDVINWYLVMAQDPAPLSPEISENAFAVHAIDPLVSKCGAQICSTIPRVGNPDVAGIGVCIGHFRDFDSTGPNTNQSGLRWLLRTLSKLLSRLYI
jgi:hypothetical protein